MSPDMILTRAVNGKPMATPRPYFSGIEKKLHSGGFKGYVLLTVIYLGDRDKLSQDYTSDLHRQNVIGVCSKNYLLKSGKASFVGIHTSAGLALTDKLQ